MIERRGRLSAAMPDNDRREVCCGTNVCFTASAATLVSVLSRRHNDEPLSTNQERFAGIAQGAGHKRECCSELVLEFTALILSNEESARLGRRWRAENNEQVIPRRTFTVCATGGNIVSIETSFVYERHKRILRRGGAKSRRSGANLSKVYPLLQSGALRSGG